MIRFTAQSILKIISPTYLYDRVKDYNKNLPRDTQQMVIQQPQISTETPALDRFSIDRLVLEITNRLVKEFNPENIFLFGSHAWGAPNSDSDLDLLVIVSNSDISSTKRSSIAYRCLRDIQYPLDILVKTRKEIEKFSQVSLSLEHQILSRGKCLYGR